LSKEKYIAKDVGADVLYSPKNIKINMGRRGRRPLQIKIDLIKQFKLKGG